MMAETMVQWLTTVFAEYVPPEIFIFFLSMVPVIELRGGIIAAALLHVPLAKAIVVCFVGNLIPIPFILLLCRPIFAWLKRLGPIRPLVEKLEARGMGKSEMIQKYEFWGLLLFVGVPLPGTGVWTGALIASLLNISIKRATPPLTLGLIMACFLMVMISYVIPGMII